MVLVEKEARLGGWTGGFEEMYPHGKRGRRMIDTLVANVREHPAVTVFVNAEVVGKSGSFGNYEVMIHVDRQTSETVAVQAGAIVVATGFARTRSLRGTGTAWKVWSRWPISRGWSTRPRALGVPG